MMEIQFTKKIIEELGKKLEEAKKMGDIKEITKITSLLLLANGVSSMVIEKLWKVSERTIRNWKNDFSFIGLQSISRKKQEGQKPKLTKEQKQELKKSIIEGPEQNEFSRGTWTSTTIKELIEKKYKVSYNKRYLCDLLKQMGFSYQKGKFMYYHCDCEARTTWKNKTWPDILELAKQNNSAILFEDESSFSQWGSLTYTWSLRGQQPIVRTGGKRKSLKVFGAIDYFSGKFVFQREEHKLNSSSYISFLKKILSRFSQKIILIHDGAPYHKSKAVKQFIQNEERLEVFLLPSYSPDLNIIECLWKKVKAFTHNKYFPDFSSLKECVHNALRRVQRDSSGIVELCSSYESMAGIVRLNAA